ncbi:uncharacterized protein VNE69_03008 [Vairimorpha necatrix]|uniref:Uncharacterized protein n=1 Tax=Vairimorpha necatrix TaxID=6039 RepID=A0AAX4J9Z4_9MICR
MNRKVFLQILFVQSNEHILKRLEKILNNDIHNINYTTINKNDKYLIEYVSYNEKNEEVIFYVDENFSFNKEKKLSIKSLNFENRLKNICFSSNRKKDNSRILVYDNTDSTHPEYNYIFSDFDQKNDKEIKWVQCNETFYIKFYIQNKNLRHYFTINLNKLEPQKLHEIYLYKYFKEENCNKPIIEHSLNLYDFHDFIEMYYFPLNNNTNNNSSIIDTNFIFFNIDTLEDEKISKHDNPKTCCLLINFKNNISICEKTSKELTRIKKLWINITQKNDKEIMLFYKLIEGHCLVEFVLERILKKSGSAVNIIFSRLCVEIKIINMCNFKILTEKKSLITTVQKNIINGKILAAVLKILQCEDDVRSYLIKICLFLETDNIIYSKEKTQIELFRELKCISDICVQNEDSSGMGGTDNLFEVFTTISHHCEILSKYAKKTFDNICDAFFLLQMDDDNIEKMEIQANKFVDFHFLKKLRQNLLSKMKKND